MSDTVEPTSRAVDGLVTERLLPRPGPDSAVAQPPSRPQPNPPEPEPSTMTLVEHLSELRRRIFICVLAVVAGGVLGFWQAPNIIVLLLQPLPGQKVVFLSLSAGFMLYLRIAIVCGVVLGLPVILYQTWAFVAPGLTERERRAILPWIPFTVIFFLAGCAVAYVTLPYAAAFLGGFQIPGHAELLPSGEAYFGFVTMIFLVFGVVMEFPIVLVLLNRLGLVKRDQLRANRRYVLMGIVVFSAVVTPGGDPVSPVVMAGTMYLLFEFTIFWMGRSKATEVDDDGG